MRSAALLLVLAILLALGGAAAGTGGTCWRFRQSTDDAYVQSDVTRDQPEDRGLHQEGAGRATTSRSPTAQVLFVIDDRDFKAKVAQAEAAVATAEATVATYESRLELQQAMIDQAAAVVKSAEADLDRAQHDYKRYSALMTSDFASRQRFETGRGRCPQGRGGARARARAALAAEQNQLAVLQSQQREEEARLQQARANLRLAQNDLDNTVIRAPVAGVAGNRAGQVGQYVKPGTQLLSLVPLPHVYVTANFKETQLTRMRPGQLAEISVDAYPGSAAARPHRELRAGQRRPVQPAAAGQRDRQFHQDRPARAGAHRAAGRAAAGRLLRPGLSVTVTVDTRDAAPADRRRASRPGAAPKRGASAR